MKNIFRISGVILLILSIVMIHSCKKKEEVPVITTTAVSNITATTALSGGNVTDEGISSLIVRGLCWSTGTTPTIAENFTEDGVGAGSFTRRLTGLNGNTKYFVRAYATNSAGTGYGQVMSFTTLTSNVPTLGLIAYYPFSGDAKDKSGSGYDGVAGGGYFNTPDRFGNPSSAYNFPGWYGSTITVDFDTPLATANFSGLSISVWVSFDYVHDHPQNILTLHDPAFVGSLIICWDNVLQKFYSLKYADISRVYSLSKHTGGRWYHLVTTLDQAQGIQKLYLDGVYQGAVSVNALMPLVSKLCIGYHIDDVGQTWYFKGIIDDIRIYNRSLNAAEIMLLYNEIP